MRATAVLAKVHDFAKNIVICLEKLFGCFFLVGWSVCLLFVRMVGHLLVVSVCVCVEF